MKTDIEIALNAKMKPISEIAEKIGVPDDALILYGARKAKIIPDKVPVNTEKPEGKLVLVTAINPTPAGEGKTTITIGLGQALSSLGVNAAIAIREPSLGPVMGVKGGAAGGGYSQVVPMEDINLHFTGDLHAITSANNLLCAMTDNHIRCGNALGIDPVQITFKRAMDMNDRALRNIIAGLGGQANGYPREDGFVITAASEIMAILCLADGLNDLKERISKIIIGYSYTGVPVTCGDLKAEGALTALLKDAVLPNLVQTLENTPAFVHGGPFANIAHGCSSLAATKLALKLCDAVVTEAGFGADLGAEKFFNIKCRYGGLKPAVAVVVATVRALKYNGGVRKNNLKNENTKALEKGFANLKKHLSNIKKFKLPAVVAVNRFNSDTEKEINLLEKLCIAEGAAVAVSEVFEKGGEGGKILAQKVMDAISGESSFEPLYPLDMPVEEKIKTVAREIYGARNVIFTPEAGKSLKKIKELDLDSLPVCIAKTQYSFSDNPALLGSPSDFDITVKDLVISKGAGFIVVLTGDITTMPGLSSKPAAEQIDVDADGNITGLF